MTNVANFQSYFPQIASFLNRKSFNAPQPNPVIQQDTAAAQPQLSTAAFNSLNTALSNVGTPSFSGIVNQAGTFLNNAAQGLLKQPPFSPNNVNLFSPQTYPSAPALQPAAARQYSNAQLTGLLVDTLGKRSLESPQALQKGLATFNNAQVAQVVPDPRLRTALASLTGSAGEGAIDVIKSGVYGQVKFGQTPSGSGAEVVLAPGATKPDIIVDSKYQYEDPRLLGVVLSHEALHQDTQISAKEELVANSLETMVYGELLLTNPSIATSGTELARRSNTKLMARINDRDAAGNMRILSSQGNVYPGGNPLNNFAEPFQPLGANTAGNAYLQSFLSKVTGQNSAGAGFTDATVNQIDQNQKLFSPIEVVGLSKILRLDVLPGLGQF